MHEKRTRPRKDSVVGKEEDVVIVKEEGCLRSTWKLGRVKELLKGRDGKVRGAVIDTVTGSRNRFSELKRPVQHLIPVECK